MLQRWRLGMIVRIIGPCLVTICEAANIDKSTSFSKKRLWSCSRGSSKELSSSKPKRTLESLRP